LLNGGVTVKSSVLLIPFACASFVASAIVAEPACGAGAPDADLETIAESVLPDQAVQGMIMQGVDVVLRGKLAKDADWQKLEQQFHGITEVYLGAVRADALSHSAASTASIRQEAIQVAAQKLAPGERALCAAYLRTSLPQRWVHQVLKPMPGETVQDALRRMSEEVDRSATPEELRRAQIFNASPAGKKCQGVDDAIAEQISGAGENAVLQSLQAAMTKGQEAAAAFAQQHTASK
jgi:hypothetical protein